MLTTALLIIGNEILSGRTQDCNIAHIATKLVERGITVTEVRVVADIQEQIVDALNMLRSENTYVFTTGGIGPTHDDITAACVSKAFGVPFVENSAAKQALMDHYGQADITGARLRMAMMPDGASLIDNPVSGAPGFKIGNVYVMAGVPSIMQAMLDNILPTLDSDDPVVSGTVSCGVPESKLAEGLEQLQNDNTDIDIGSYPKFTLKESGVSVVIRGRDPARVESVMDAVAALIRSQGETPQIEAVG